MRSATTARTSSQGDYWPAEDHLSKFKVVVTGIGFVYFYSLISYLVGIGLAKENKINYGYATKTFEERNYLSPRAPQQKFPVPHVLKL
jgi:hypothetical protein